MFFLILLTACSSGSASPVAPTNTQGGNNQAVVLPAKITPQSVPMILDPSQVPPDPGSAGDATVAGIDSNNNGIRDDVERWIAQTYPSSAKMRAAAAQVALSFQDRVTSNGLTVNTAYQRAVIATNAMSCLIKSSEDTRVPDDLKGIMAAQLNTRQRTNAYISFESTLGSRAFKMPKGDTCDISASLPN
jgi:hypothetical protein